MFDNTKMFIQSTNDVTANVTGEAVEFPGEDMRELYVGIFAPQATGTTPKLVATLEESSDKVNWKVVATSEPLTTKGNVTMHACCKKRWRRVVLTVTGTTPNFGKVIAGLVTSGNQRNW